MSGELWEEPDMPPPMPSWVFALVLCLFIALSIPPIIFVYLQYVNWWIGLW